MRILSFNFSTKNCETDEDCMLDYVQQAFNNDINTEFNEEIEPDDDEIEGLEENYDDINEEQMNEFIVSLETESEEFEIDDEEMELKRMIIGTLKWMQLWMWLMKMVTELLT